MTFSIRSFAKITIVLPFLLLVGLWLGVVSEVRAAEGDLVWDIAHNPTGTENDYASAVAVDSTGVYVGGVDGVYGSNLQMRIQKRNIVNGSMIWEKTYNPSASLDVVSKMVVDSSGLYLAGMINWFSGSQGSWQIEKRSLATGDVIWQKTQDLSAVEDTVRALAVDATGLYVGGYENKSLFLTTDARWRLQKRSLVTGDLIWDRSENYLPMYAVNDGWLESVNSLAVDSSGLYLGGYVTGGHRHIQKRSLSTGDIIWSNSQTFPTMMYGIGVNVSDVVTDGTGLYVGGINLASYGDIQWLIQKRNLSNGSLMWERTQNPTGGQVDYLSSLAIDANGLYLGGSDYASQYLNTDTTPTNWRLQKRDLNTGNVLWEQVQNPSSGLDLLNGITLDSQGIYLAGFDRQIGNKQWRIQKRELTPSNLPPTTPTISGPATGITGGSYTFGATATDPDAGATIRYGFDWDMNGSVDTWAPATSYVGSGVAQSATQSWATPGIKTFQVLAEDEKGGRSAWAQRNITISDQPQFIVCPAATTLYVGDIYALEARYWSNSPIVPGCSTPGYTDVTSSANWSSSNTTVATVTNTGTRGEVEVMTPGSATITVTYSGLSDTTAITGTLPLPVITVNSAADLIRSGNTTEVTVAVTANYNATCIVYGAQSSPVTLTHTASPAAVTYPAITTKALTSAQIVQVVCAADGYPAINASEQHRINVVPTIQEI